VFKVGQLALFGSSLTMIIANVTAQTSGLEGPLASFAAVGWHLREGRRNVEPAIERQQSSKLHESGAVAEEIVKPRHMVEELQ
jgi:hypothetical protein